MIEVLQSILALIVTLSILVTIHEYGHYIVARYFNVHVLRFSVGFGKPFFSVRGKPPAPVPPPADQKILTSANEPLEGTEFAVAAIPLGGYVKFLDEREGFVADDQLHLAYNRKPVLQRMAIAAAGPIANFLLAIVAYWVLFTAGVTGVVPVLGDLDKESLAGKAGLRQGQEVLFIDDDPTRTWADVNMALFARIGDTGEIKVTVREAAGSSYQRDYRISIDRWLSTSEAPNPAAELGMFLNYPEIPAVIGGVVEGGAAEAAGMQVNDKVVGFNGQSVKDWPEFVGFIQAHPNQFVELQVLRNSETVYLTATPNSIERDGKQVGFLGAQRIAIDLPEEMQREVAYPIYSAWIPALQKTASVTIFTLDSMKKMIQGAISPKNLSGPITIAQVANATAKSGLESFIGFIALLSISLGVINLLPIPILDGGHLLYYLVELVSGRPVSERVQVWGVQMGMFIIVSIMILAFYNDLMRL